MDTPTKRTRSEKGEKISFETSASNIHKLMGNEMLSIVDDFDKQIGLEINEIEPLGNGLIQVTATIIWVEIDDPAEK